MIDDMILFVTGHSGNTILNFGTLIPVNLVQFCVWQIGEIKKMCTISFVLKGGKNNIPTVKTSQNASILSKKLKPGELVSPHGRNETNLATLTACSCIAS